MKNVYIITGAPGSGKSTYVRNRKAPNDLVIDLDYICAALQQDTNVHNNHDAVYQAAVCMRDSLYPFIAMRYGNWNDCWIITGEARRDKLKELAKKVGATDIIEMETALTETLNRIDNDQSRVLRAEDFKEMAKRWHALHDRPPLYKKIGDTKKTGGATFFFLSRGQKFFFGRRYPIGVGRNWQEITGNGKKSHRAAFWL